MLMVKPGMPYLDIVREVKDKVSRQSREKPGPRERSEFVHRLWGLRLRDHRLSGFLSRNPTTASLPRNHYGHLPQGWSEPLNHWAFPVQEWGGLERLGDSVG